MKEITDLAWFAKILRSKELRFPRGDQGSGYSPFRSLEYECPCGARHTLKKNQYGFLVPQDFHQLLGDPSFNHVRPEIFLEPDQILMNCSNLNGLVLVSVDKKLFNHTANATHFIDYTTLNNANKGFGLMVETPDLLVDFNVVGQSRKDYPTEEITTQNKMEKALLIDPEENILAARQYFADLTDEFFDCPCGTKHSMGGVREDFSLVQYGKEVTVPVLTVLNDLSKMTWKSVLYRCSERYTMVAWRPSKPALWSAKVDLISSQKAEDSVLPQEIFNAICSHTQRLEMERFLINERDNN